MKISGAIFDMDGTLVDSLGFWDYIWRLFGEKFLSDPTFRPDPVTEKAVRTASLYDAMTLVHKSCRIGKDGDEVFNIANEELIRFYKETVPLKDGVIEFLEHLKSCGVKMCVASATDSALIEILMKRFGLDRFFPAVFSCNDVGRGKEFPDVFIKAHEYLGTDKDGTWIFEDSIVALETAARAGFKTVGIHDKFNFGLERVKQISTVYIGEGASLSDIIKDISV